MSELGKLYNLLAEAEQIADAYLSKLDINSQTYKDFDVIACDIANVVSDVFMYAEEQ